MVQSKRPKAIKTAQRKYFSLRTIRTLQSELSGREKVAHKKCSSLSPIRTPRSELFMGKIQDDTSIMFSLKKGKIGGKESVRRV
jgi:hypothetical protein